MRALIAVLLLAGSLLAQMPDRNLAGQLWLVVLTSPTGVCSTRQPLRFNNSTGEVFGCTLGSWAKLGTAAGVVGQVGFYGSTTSLIGDNALFWDNTTKRLGIGTATPGAAVEVAVGNVYVSGAGNGYVGNIFQFPGSTQLNNTSDGVFKMLNAAGSDFNRLQWGGATSAFPSIQRSGAGLIARLADDSADTTLRTAKATTESNCSSSAAPAVCASAAAGSVVVAAGATTVVVNTTAITANSQVFLMFDSSLGTKLSVTCNVTEPALYGVTARTAATSFTITCTSPAANPACFSYLIVN